MSRARWYPFYHTALRQVVHIGFCFSNIIFLSSPHTYFNVLWYMNFIFFKNIFYIIYLHSRLFLALFSYQIEKKYLFIYLFICVYVCITYLCVYTHAHIYYILLYFIACHSPFNPWIPHFRAYIFISYLFVFKNDIRTEL